MLPEQIFEAWAKRYWLNMEKILWPILSLVLMFLIPVIVVSTIAKTIDGVFDFTNDNGTSTRFRLKERIVEKIDETREVLGVSILVVCVYQNIDNLSKLNDCFSGGH